MKTVDYILPEFWIPALANGDLSGMNDEDIVAFNHFIDASVALHGRFWFLGPVDDRGNGTMQYHDARDYGIGSCDCFTARFDVDRI